MHTAHRTPLESVLLEQLGPRSWSTLERALVRPDLGSDALRGDFGQSEVALGLALVLFDDLCERVPLAWAYTRECAESGEPVQFDHGAMRTVALPTGGLPAGRASVARILEPLGYRHSATYPLDGIRMTGFVYTHEQHPSELPQYFVSELEPTKFSAEFQDKATELLATSVDPLSEWARAQLALLERGERIERADLVRLLPNLAASFARHHREPTLKEYETFARESAEMAWIATEGHSFNHITDRVPNVGDVADEQRHLGRPIKPEIEVSRSGRVRQTALRAAEVERLFDTEDGFVTRRVPGSFLEFISRDTDETGALDLGFDAQNAQGIFKMTDGAR